MQTRHKQNGVVLLIGLMMLILLTLMAVAALKFGTANFALVNNQQRRGEAVRAAEQVIDQIISNQEIQMTGGTNLFGIGNNAVQLDINGDGTADYTVTVNPPVCVKRQVISQTKLNFGVADDLACARSVDQASLGVEGSGAGDSLCSEVVWDVNAEAVDAFNQNSIEVIQGIGQRVATTRIATVCD